MYVCVGERGRGGIVKRGGKEGKGGEGGRKTWTYVGFENFGKDVISTSVAILVPSVYLVMYVCIHHH